MRERKRSDSAAVAIVLPPREAFSPGATGAVGLMAHRLASRGDAVVIGSPGGVPHADVPFRPVRSGRWPLGSQTARYAAAAARLLAELRPTLIEVHNRPEIALHVARRFPSAKIALLLHNEPTEMRGARRPAERLALLKNLSGIAVVSDYLRRGFLENLPPACGDRLRVLPNCIDLAALGPAPAAAARERRVLFAGRVVRDKGADTFVAACARALPKLPGWRATMIGADRFRPDSPETPFTRRLRPEAERAGVECLGYQPHAAVLDVMHRAAIVVVPSRWQEPFGLTALEAMACGAALVTTRRGGLPEVAGDAALYAGPDDPDGLADAIAGLASDEKRRGALAEAGRERARLFDLPQALARLDAFREEILFG
ncbi:MAG: glycosyltransferase family 4 protein [Acidisphaera sp.]|nr:glycosyltransferase family 4 protein [Acidisphaera sp.]